MAKRRGGSSQFLPQNLPLLNAIVVAVHLLTRGFTSGGGILTYQYRGGIMSGGVLSGGGGYCPGIMSGVNVLESVGERR